MKQLSLDNEIGAFGKQDQFINKAREINDNNKEMFIGAEHKLETGLHCVACCLKSFHFKSMSDSK